MEFREEYQELQNSNRQLKRSKVPLENQKVKQQFKKYLKEHLNQKLTQLKEEFLLVNVPQSDSSNDTFIQLDLSISLQLFGTIIDVDNLQAFDKYLVNYFIYNNMVRVDEEYPEINIKNKPTVAQFWKAIMEQLKLKNGDKFTLFLNQLRAKKMVVMSRKVKKQKEIQNLLHDLKQTNWKDISRM